MSQHELLRQKEKTVNKHSLRRDRSRQFKSSTEYLALHSTVQEIALTRLPLTPSPHNHLHLSHLTSTQSHQPDPTQPIPSTNNTFPTMHPPLTILIILATSAASAAAQAILYYPPRPPPRSTLTPTPPTATPQPTHSSAPPNPPTPPTAPAHP